MGDLNRGKDDEFCMPDDSEAALRNNITVSLLDDNAKPMISNRRTPPSVVPGKSQESASPTIDLKNPTPLKPPPPPPHFNLEKKPSNSPRLYPKQGRRPTAQSRGTKAEMLRRHVERWGGGNESPPIAMPKCPKRTSLSPTRIQESPIIETISLSSMATQIVASNMIVPHAIYNKEESDRNKCSSRRLNKQSLTTTVSITDDA